ncbi:MAG: hypothetical protein JW874_01335 [Spirochaetales bacterium]|nr:hypothetical protein [Spirochaetales bacterium]
MNLNNKKTAMVIPALLLIGFLVLPGCASLKGGIPQPWNSEDTLVAVPVIVIEATSEAWMGKITYQIKMENSDTRKSETIYVTTSSHGYAYIRGLAEGKYLVQEFSTPEGMMGSNARTVELDNYLVVEKGKLSVFPGKLVVYVFNKAGDNDSNYVYPRLRDIDEKQLERIKKYLATDENFILWK